jgi:hypothetical protein
MGQTVWALLRGGDAALAREGVPRFGAVVGANRRFRIPYLRARATLAQWEGAMVEEKLTRLQMRRWQTIELCRQHTTSCEILDVGTYMALRAWLQRPIGSQQAAFRGFHDLDGQRVHVVWTSRAIQQETLCTCYDSEECHIV